VDVLLAHTNTSEHPSSRVHWLTDLVDSLHGYDELPPDQVSALQTLEDQRDFSKKAVLDYIQGLESCYNTQAPWIAVFEDDVLFADGWLARTLHGLQGIQQQFTTSENDWLFLRLFNQERSIGWASRTPGQNHEVLISMSIMVLMLPGLLFTRSRLPTGRKYLDNATIVIICFLAIPTFVVLFFQAGKASVLPPAPGVHREPFGCCSQAMVFPRVQIPRIKAYLTSRISGQIDLMLDDLAVEDSLDRYALYPVQVQHIGTMISLLY